MKLLYILMIVRSGRKKEKILRKDFVFVTTLDNATRHNKTEFNVVYIH
jgi:hypothetical protein